MNNKMRKLLLKNFKTVYVAFFLATFLLTAVSAQAIELNSATYKITDAEVGDGNQMNSTNFSVSGSLSQSSVGSWVSEALPLVRGTITSCGKITMSGTYTLGSDITGITGSCFTVLASGVTIDGGGHAVTAGAGNTRYAVVATSTSSGGNGYDVTLQNITFNNFAGGVNASGNNGAVFGGWGGNVTVTSSDVGSVLTNGGSGSVTGGSGGSITISGTSLNLAGKTINASGGSGFSTGTRGVIKVDGSVLVSPGQSWAGDDSLWTGTRTWNFLGDAYNTGTTTGATTFSATAYSSGRVSGDAIFLAYTATGNGVTIDGDSNFRGTGSVGGLVLDSQGATITAWDLRNNSILTGSLTGDIIFHDTSHNNGMVIGNATFEDSSYNSGTVLSNSIFNNLSYNKGVTNNATFTASSFNSTNGIPNGDPTGISDGHSVAGTLTFSATSSVNFTINTGATWRADTTSWIFTTLGQNWIFNFGSNEGVLSGGATFNNAQNRGRVNGESIFYTNSYNSGLTAAATFHNNSYNIGTSTQVSFYETSINSHNPLYGTATSRCDFYDSSLPGIGHCPSSSTFYHIPYYYKNSVSTNWSDIGNWWFDASSTQPAQDFPQTGDTVFIGAQMTSGPILPITMGSIIVASSTTGGGNFSVNFTNVSGPAYFYASSMNTGEVRGVFHVFGNRSFSQVNDGTNGTFTSDVIFHNGSWNDVTIPGNAIFYDTSYNSVSGRVGGNAEFAGINKNDGTVVGVGIVDTGAVLSGSGTILSSASNSGNISSGTFNEVVTNMAGAVTGAVTNLKEMIFNGGSYVSASGRLSGNAQFTASSSNWGIVSGTSTFKNLSFNVGTTSEATFVGDLTENAYNGVMGFVSGIKTRLYDALNPQLNVFRDFTDSAWTIIADNTFVKLIYSNLVDVFGKDSRTTTTLVMRNGGFILRPLATSSPVTSCGILDTENGTYTLGSDISNYKYDSCFIVRANGVTLDGAGHSVTADSDNTSLYAVVATSTISIDATSSAFTNLTIQNISFNNFAHGLLGRGNDVPIGIGGDGASTTITHTVIGDIDLSGGDPTEQAGNGGNLTLETSTTTVIVADGGNSTACGIGGNGGNISITTDSVFATSSNRGGDVSGCHQNDTVHYGSHGITKTNIISKSTRAAAEAATKAQSAQAVAVTSVARPQQALGLQNIFNILPPIAKLAPIKLKALPTFGDTELANSFSFVQRISNFMFSPLPKNLNPFTAKILKSLGVNLERDMLTLKKKPIAVPLNLRTPGLFRVSVPGIPTKLFGGNFVTSQVPVVSYVTYDSKTSLSQVIKVLPKTQLTINVTPVNSTKFTASFNGKDIRIDQQGNVHIESPTETGTYTLTTSASPITLTIQVLGKDIKKTSTSDSSTSTVIGILKKAYNFILSLF